MSNPYRIVAAALTLAATAALSAGTGRALATDSAPVEAIEQQPPPRITNTTISTRPAGSPFAQSFRSLVAAQNDVAWIAYAAPVVDGERIMCCFNNDTVWVNGSVVTSSGRNCCGVCRIEPAADGTSMARRAPATPTTNAVRLQGSERMIVTFRVAARDTDRIRVFSEDCELDAGGRLVIWLDGVRAADSIALLESLMAPAEKRVDRITDGAISAIALHGDPAADAALERLVAATQPEPQRKKV